MVAVVLPILVSVSTVMFGGSAWPSEPWLFYDCSMSCHLSF